MAYEEVSVVQVREILRRWLRGDQGLRKVAEGAGVDRKTVRRYVGAAEALGATREGGEAQLTDELVAGVVGAVHPGGRAARGESWAALEADHDYIKGLVEKGVTVAKVGDVLARRSVVVPERTLQRYCAERCKTGAQKTTVRLSDPDPGKEVQTDFGRMGLMFDPATSRRRVVHALILVAVWSRHMFVWLTFTQTTADVIEGMERAWAFFGGVFPVLIPDNLSPVVTKADATEPRFNATFLEYSQERGFLIDAARVRRPQDKARCERQVPYVRSRFFAEEDFVGLADGNRRVEAWCLQGAGTRTHRTTQCRPIEAFRTVEQPLLLPPPAFPYDTPSYSEPKVHRDHHVEVGRAIYSVPGDLIGKYINARADSKTVKLYSRGELIKVHPRKPPGGRSTDPADLPSERTAYAMRDISQLVDKGHRYGKAVGAYVEALVDHPLPWTKMRQVYRLFGLVEKWGAERTGAACARALDAEAVSVGLVERMLERAKENDGAAEPGAQEKVAAGRFSRDASEFHASTGAQGELFDDEAGSK
jgi:transposase